MNVIILYSLYLMRKIIFVFSVTFLARFDTHLFVAALSHRINDGFVIENHIVLLLYISYRSFLVRLRFNLIERILTFSFASKDIMPDLLFMYLTWVDICVAGTLLEFFKPVWRCLSSQSKFKHALYFYDFQDVSFAIKGVSSLSHTSLHSCFTTTHHSFR